MINDALQLDKVTGTLQTVIFASSDSYFKILLINIEESTLDNWDTSEIIVTGTFADVQDGSVYSFYGHVVKHPRYGKQFQVERYENDLPPDEAGLIKYFASGQFSGIGKKTAEKIVQNLGTNAVDLILDNAKILENIGLKPKQAQKLARTLQLNLGLERLFQIGNQFGIGADIAGRLYDQYGNEAQNILTQDPYRLVFEFEGISFKKADTIGQQNGVLPLDERRLQAAVYSAIMNVTFQSGHTFLTKSQLLQAVGHNLKDASGMLTVEITQATDTLLNDGILVADDDRIYPKSLYEAEVQVAQDVKRLLHSPSPLDVGHDDIEKAYTAPGKIDLDDNQIQAVKSALQAQFFLLTGGPGTGKTTIIRSIVASWKQLVQKRSQFVEGDKQDFLKQYTVRMASPTGRAAKRMTEVTGYEATTIHRLLGIADLDEAEFNADNPLRGGLLIVDEASMLDVELTAKLLQAIPNGMKLIFVGDSDQLPSVGPGNILADFVNSGVVDHVALEIIYRQGRGSSITTLANNIKHGDLPESFLENQPDRSTFMIPPDKVPDAIEQVVNAAMKKGYTQDDLQILTPMYKTPAGVNRLNQMAQALFNPIKAKQKTIQFGNIIYRRGDKVLQLENDGERDVYNGDMGKIIAVQYKNDPSNDDNEDRLIVAFDDKELSYPKKNLNQLTLAYATTVHKAQGNEFRLVLMVLTSSFGIMLNRNLLYTGVTRAKEALILIGEHSAFKRAAQTAVPLRATHLLERLQSDDKISTNHQKIVSNADVTDELSDLTAAYHPSIDHFVLTGELISHQDIDPMIGMDDLKPIDFEYQEKL